MTTRGLGILAGPGVVRAGAVEGLRAFAHRTGGGVVNTWGAKGVFRWDDPRHHGTAGLQARDFELAGLADVEVLVTTGLDPAEVTSRPWEGRAEVVDVAPEHLAGTSLRLPPGRLARPPLYDAIAAVVGPRYADAASPPGRAQALAEAMEPGGLVVAEPGLAGFWVARTFPTAVAGSVAVPASADPAAAWSIARRAAAEGRAVSLVTAAPDRLPALPGVVVVSWAEVDLDPAALVAVAGGIVAWGGVPLAST